MLQQLISHSPDIKRLVDEGYDIEVAGGQFILARQIPYVNAAKKIQYGIIVCALTLASASRTARPQDHTAYFSGDKPCDSDGNALVAIINNSNTQQLAGNISVNHYFSSKPACGYYDNYYDKIRTYAEILLAQARTLDPTVTTRPNKLKIA